MKKIILLLNFVLMAVASASAQVYIAPEGGALLGKINMNFPQKFYKSYSVKAQYGYKGGCNFRIDLSKHLAVETGLFFRHITFQVTLTPYKTIYYYPPVTYKLDYVQLPVTINYGFDFGRIGTLFIGAGGYISNIFNAKLQAGGGDDEPLLLGKGAGYNFRPFGAGALGYIGYRLPFGLYIRAQYCKGLTNVNAQSDNLEEKNEAFAVSVGYEFQIWSSGQKTIY